MGGSVGLWLVPASADESFHKETGDAGIAQEWPDHGTYFTYCWDGSISAALDHHIAAAERLLENYTVVNVRRHEPCRNTGSGRSDVRWQEGNLSPGLSGSTFCRQPNVNGLCDQYISTIDKAAIRNDPDIEHKANQLRKTACHELGHAATLGHYPRSGDPAPQMTRHDCMRNNEWDSGSFHSHSYENHHIYDHINAYF